MTARRTWIWIVVGVLGTGVLLLVAVAGVGVYFISQHIQGHRVSGPDAIRAFDEVRARFGDAQPLYEIDTPDGPRLTRPFSEAPSGTVMPSDLCVLAWNPEEQRLVRVRLPLWLLRYGHHHMQFDGRDFDLNQLELDPDELQHLGPALLVDYRNREGVRVMLWTE